MCHWCQHSIRNINRNDFFFSVASVMLHYSTKQSFDVTNSIRSAKRGTSFMTFSMLTAPNPYCALDQADGIPYQHVNVTSYQSYHMHCTLTCTGNMYTCSYLNSLLVLRIPQDHNLHSVSYAYTATMQFEYQKPS